MRNLIFLFIGITVISACNQSSEYANDAAFITKLGVDTLAVEQFSWDDNTITADVILRSPQTTLSSYKLELDSLGGIKEMTKTMYSGDDGFNGNGETTHSIERSGDSLYVEIQTSEGTRNFVVAYEQGILPFIDMVHWPFEIAFKNAAESEQDSIYQRLLTGGRVSTFVIADIEGDSMTIRHPFRGVMGVHVDANGHIQHLDAAQTTRKLTVERVQDVDIDAIATNFIQKDKSGNPFGQLSGAAESEFNIQNALIRVEYGVPQKRGRELFGGIVPWGEVWRTGANRATHFYTSDDLTFGDLDVPAGEYTLFTIPERDGGSLIINKETGQNGNSYNESEDLGRVPMQISSKEEETEAFTINVDETQEGGVLQLIWGEKVFSVDFSIK